MPENSVLGRVVVGIPTFRRPLELAKLLQTLQAEVSGIGRVIVADNAGDPRTPEIVSAHLPGIPHTVIGVAEPGISAVRNELIRTATELVPDWEWLAMLDDDGAVMPGWLTTLIGAGEAYDADVVGGPVLGDLPPGSGLLARNSNYAGRARWATGPVDFIHGAQNTAVRRRIVNTIPAPWFDPRLGLTGGEDYDFFHAVRAAGGRLVWCDEATVVEPTPVDRLSARAILERAFQENRMNAYTDLKHIDVREARANVRLGVARSARNTAAALIRRDPDRLAATFISAVGLAGRAVGYAQEGRRARESSRLVGTPDLATQG